jgi:hypothetical protein
LRKEVQALAARFGVTVHELWSLDRSSLVVKPAQACACGHNCGSELCGVLTYDNTIRSFIVQIYEESQRRPAIPTRMPGYAQAIRRGE